MDSTEKTRSIPRHIAMIMDGNGRWAKKRGSIRLAGHRAGAETVRRRAVATVRITHQEEAPIRSLPDTEGKMDINRATAEDLQAVSGIGPALAQRILDEREARKGFHFLEELMDVSGIGEKRYEALSALFYCPVSAP